MALEGWRSSVAILTEIDTKLKIAENSPDYYVLLIANMFTSVVVA